MRSHGFLPVFTAVHRTPHWQLQAVAGVEGYDWSYDSNSAGVMEQYVWCR